jgi:protein involved in polysaccharide export with SLBB domain
VPQVAPFADEASITPFAPNSPAGPRKIKRGDVLNLDVMDNLDSLGVKGLRLLLQSGTTLTVDDDGSLSLGSQYGHVGVEDKTLQEAEETIEKLLLAKIRDTWDKMVTDKPGLEIALGNLQINVRLQFVKPKSLAVAVPGVTTPVTAPTPRPVATPYPRRGAALPPDDEPKVAGPAITPEDETLFPSAAPKKEGIQPGDTLSIDFEPPEAQVKQVVTVEPDGSIALGVTHGRVQVGGKTLTEAEAIVQERVAKAILNPSIQVTMGSRGGDRHGAADMNAIIADLQRQIAESKAHIRNLEEARRNLEKEKAQLARVAEELTKEFRRLQQARDAEHKDK